MNEEQLKTFIAINESGSFTASESKIFISKQAAMKQINSLEHELGFKLFIRNHNGVTLTKQGEIFYTGTKELLQKKNELIEKCYSLDKQSTVRIGNTEHQTLLDPVNIAFSKKYPQIKLKRIINPNHSGEWRVDNNIQDVAETFNIGTNNYKNSIYYPLITREYKVIMSMQHPLSNLKEVSLDNIIKYPVTIYPLMIKDVYLDEIHCHFKNHEENLYESYDLDHQVEVVYQCMNSNHLLISANPFIETIEDIIKLPLAEHFTIEYGILCHKPVSDSVEKYIQTAKEVFK